MELLVDSYGRRIKSMRISITDKCNFRCIYCMPTEGLPWLPKREFLSYEEIERIARVAVSIGIEQIRLTGGEPLVLTADGQLRTCLFTTKETDLRSIIRSGADDETLAYTFHQAVRHKELKHFIGDKQFKRANRSMSMIGG